MEDAIIAGLGVLLAVLLLVQLPSAYTFQSGFNRSIEEIRQRRTVPRSALPEPESDESEAPDDVLPGRTTHSLGKGMGETGMDRPHREVVQVGISGARIVAVTRQRIDYIDMAGQARYVDVEECARRWGQWRHEHRREFLPLPGSSEQGIAAWNARCVGERGALDNPPWVEFRNERGTRFVFETRDALYRELLTPLRKAGWHTFDTD